MVLALIFCMEISWDWGGCHFMGLSRKVAMRVNAFDKNINKRGVISTAGKERKYPVKPILIAGFLFIVVGSVIVQIILSSQRGSLS
ncbi:putative ribosome associated membrane protein RAMP4 [Cardiosporidium cionae]|uniref:Ribosome associated membrane protein RAMP4 n=1 Tax=Cardiosporidium cionae TaxID=476202 RepID=A0ABQ7JE59_9APIC|nr:putative ribosome associated membrane protein RAMP4 [Cardiosporidium cionae]|eukprot:KAF8822195.1 putative ribosome associated membrane protein RAMP4 [Cardiosporidium cionae]